MHSIPSQRHHPRLFPASILAALCCLAGPVTLRAEEPAAGSGANPAWSDHFAPRFDVDFGQIVKGKTGTAEFEYQAMNRNTVTLAGKGDLGGEWKFDATLMGLIWWPFNTSPSEPVNRTMRSEFRLGQTAARRDFSSSAWDPRFLELGYLRYKYNRDARNLGEYLHRSGTYPGIVTTTDGFQLMDNALYESVGAHLRYSLGDGLIVNDLTLFAETEMAPIGDLTPAYEISLNTSVLQIGVGAAFNRLIAWRPSRLQPKTPDNTFARVTDVVADSAGVKDTVVISGRLDGIAAFAPLDTAIVDYWKKGGLKLMARAALDLGFLLPDGLKGPEDLRIFGEIAVLGWENQGFFYEKRSERMPIMAGINIPTFTLLDLLSVQGEYYACRFDNIASYTTVSSPIWDVESFSSYDPDEFKRDDWKWSVHAVRSIGRLAKLKLQVANDHLRMREFVLQQSDETLTRRPSHWYYLMRLEFGI